MSSQWSRVFTKPAGAIPGGLFGQIVVALTTLLIAAFIIAYAIQGGSTEEERETTAGEPVLAGEGIQRRVDQSIEQQQRLEQTRRAAQARDRLRAQIQQPGPGQQTGPGRPATRTAGMTQSRTIPWAAGSPTPATMRSITWSRLKSPSRSFSTNSNFRPSAASTSRCAHSPSCIRSGLNPARNPQPRLPQLPNSELRPFPLQTRTLSRSGTCTERPKT